MTDDEQRHFEVMLEEINHHVKIIDEGHNVLHGEIRTTREYLEEKINENTSLIKHVHDALSVKIDGVEQRLDEKIDGAEQRLDAKIDGVENKLGHEMQSMGAKLDAKIDGVEQGLGARIDGVEQRLRKDMQEMGARLTGEIRAVGDKVDGHEARITTLEQQAA